MTKMKKFIAEIDEAELACRIIEGVLGLRRPEGLTAAQAVDAIEDSDGWRNGARMALQYITECINEAKVPS
jgi:hypothetical protein